MNTEEDCELSNNISSTGDHNPPSTLPTSTQPYSLSPSGIRERRAAAGGVPFPWGGIIENHLYDHYSKVLILSKAVVTCIIVISYSALMLYKVLIYMLNIYTGIPIKYYMIFREVD